MKISILYFFMNNYVQFYHKPFVTNIEKGWVRAIGSVNIICRPYFWLAWQLTILYSKRPDLITTQLFTQEMATRPHIPFPCL